MRTITTAILLLLTTASANAVTIEGVNIPASVTVDDTVLVLNGAGVRKRFFVNVYIGALYLLAKETTAEAILTSSGTKSVRLHFLYSEVDVKKLADAWIDGFKNNNGEAEYDALRPRIERFNALFRTVKRGETILIDLHSSGNTTVTINGEQRGEIAGADFQQALLKIWLGRQPADKRLKRAMLGTEE